MNAGLEHLDAREIEELRALFFAQAGETLDQVQQELLRLEREGVDAGTVRSVKRALHTIKGDATSMGYDGPGRLCHRLEDVLAGIAADPRGPGEGLDLLFAGVDAVEGLLGALRGGAEAAVPAGLEGRIDAFLGGGPGEDRRPAGLTEQELDLARAAAEQGLELFDVEIALDPGCRQGQVGALMVRERLRLAATVIAVRPDPERAASASAVSFRFLAAAADIGAVEAAARLPGVVSRAVVLPGAQSLAVASALVPSAPRGAAAPEGERREVLRVDAEKIDTVLELVGELIVGRSMLEQAVREADAAAPGAEFVERLRAASAAVERTAGDLQKGALRMRMVPLRYLFRKFPRVVRDLAHQLGKQTHLEIEGQETELDKGIVDALFEPLNHLVRNMVDHGIEPPEARIAAGKPAEGRITLRAYQEAARIVVEVADDGRGIDTAKLLRRAVERGFVAEQAAESLGAEAALQLVFLSGVSTADGVSETSGRGVGMDAVKSALEAVKGTVEVESRPGRGTCFRLRLPMTLAVIRTLLFDAGGRLFALPVAAIAEVARVRPGELTTVDGRPCLRLRDQIVSVIPLGELFGAAAGDEGRFVLVLALRGRRFGVLVERLHWQQEVVIKSVDERWIDAGVVAGASILGDGGVVLVLDAAAVVARAIEREKAGRGAS